MDEKPKLLYHYTSIEAFKGILEDQCLRMTKYDQMNDPQEVIFALEIMKNFLCSYSCAEEYKEFKEFLLEELEQYKGVELELYIASFTEKIDNLDQWRAYTKDGGVSIGFDFKELDSGYLPERLPEGNYNQERGFVKKDTGGLESVRPLFKLFPCKYDSSNTRDNIEKKIKEWFAFNGLAGMFIKIQNGEFDNPKNKLESVVKLLFLGSLGQFIYNIIVTTKHEAYSGEKEWRWININPDSERFEERLDEKNRVYVKARIHPEAFIKEVWISPHGERDVIRRVVDFYKEKYNLPYEIHESKIPYRLP